MRRRRPVLGTALLIGASRSAARHEVEEQARRDAEIQREAEIRRLEEEKREAHAQLAIKEAVSQEVGRQERQSQLAYDQAMTKGGITNQTPQPGVHPSYGDDSHEANIRYCVGCGNACKREDNFCGRCGRKQFST
ncbi:hypothetical protein POJ06DRAFT_145745 [Lipomyces tetrasporus]|uniref:Uncharacterized protein n=1 Tax=Lipomyces tetrasporus TaxID=54092 RepID=A0AAD7VRH8_9ASCO|nr:uncharacterized protein POJ06DRAFT_145745 [Lipomyces tetrasporus]KAJ8098140.1 hypothetical protein POJ06DRAFT_145745 [Lipomyces tetrasporus]